MGSAEASSSEVSVVRHSSEPLAPLRHGEFFLLHETGLEIQRSPTYEAWAEMGHVFALAHKALPFAIGDWLNFGEDRFGEEASQAVDVSHFSEETLKVYRWVSKQIPMERRFPNLTFKHHMVVAGMPEARQRTWLGKASIGEWSVATLQREIRDAVEDGETKWWLVVGCKDHADLEKLKSEMESSGRSCKEKEERERTPGKPRKALTVKPKKAAAKKGRKKPSKA